jgi:hypothetical protein
MDENGKRTKQVDRLTDDRISSMSEEMRALIAREFAGGGADAGTGSPEAPGSRGAAGTPGRPVRPGTAADEQEAAEAAARLAAEIHRTERRIDRIERSSSGGRYQGASTGGPSGRYARLLSRSARLERRRRALKSQQF